MLQHIPTGIIEELKKKYSVLLFNTEMEGNISERGGYSYNGLL